MNILGIMSGTSMDGVDYTLCAMDARRCELLDLWSVPYPARLRVRIAASAANESTSHELAQLHHDLGRFYAKHARAGRSRKTIQLAGLHGQTVFHNPRQPAPATLQVGEPAYLAEALRVPVVGNFRAADLAAGGQGAPLATAFHVRVFGRPDSHVCVNNLGGISNVTSIPSRRSEVRGQKSEVKVFSFDTGPANVLLDLAASHFSGGRRACDRGGRLAARGRPCEALILEWLRHPYFRRQPPKSTGRELFGEPFFQAALPQFRRHRLGECDVLATLTEFTARSIAFNYALYLPAPPDEVVLCGGGAANPTLVAAIQRNLSQSFARVRVVTSMERGWPLQSVEPAAFAWLAWLRWNRRPGNLPATTGARRALLMGQVVEV
jgi:anhydro-N-acetylmuramic acid kinase